MRSNGEQIGVGKFGVYLSRLVSFLFLFFPKKGHTKRASKDTKNRFDFSLLFVFIRFDVRELHV